MGQVVRVHSPILESLARRAFGQDAYIGLDRGDHGWGFTVVAGDTRIVRTPSEDSLSRAEMLAGALLQALVRGRSHGA